MHALAPACFVPLRGTEPQGRRTVRRYADSALVQAEQLDADVQAHLHNSEHIAMVDEATASALLVAAQDEIASLQRQLSTAQQVPDSSPNFNTTAAEAPDSQLHDAQALEEHDNELPQAHPPAQPAQHVRMELSPAQSSASSSAPRIRVRLRVSPAMPGGASSGGIADNVAALQRITGQYNRACNKLVELKAALQAQLADTAEAAASRHGTESTSVAGQRSRRDTADSAASFASSEWAGTEAISTASMAASEAPVAAAARVLVRLRADIAAHTHEILNKMRSDRAVPAG